MSNFGTLPAPPKETLYPLAPPCLPFVVLPQGATNVLPVSPNPLFTDEKTEAPSGHMHSLVRVPALACSRPCGPGWWDFLPIIEANSSGVELPAAMKVAPATSSLRWSFCNRNDHKPPGCDVGAVGTLTGYFGSQGECGKLASPQKPLLPPP